MKKRKKQPNTPTVPEQADDRVSAREMQYRYGRRPAAIRKEAACLRLAAVRSGDQRPYKPLKRS